MSEKDQDKNLEQRSEEVVEVMNSFCEQTCEEILNNPRGNINEKILLRF